MSTEKDTTYNGWTNYETWAVNLHLTNEPGSAELLREIVEEEDYPYSFNRDSYERGNALKEMVRQCFMPELDVNQYGMASDLLNAALSEVNWREIVENHADDNS